MPAFRSREGHRALVLGLGRTGVAVLRHLRRQGAFARGADRRADLPLPADLEEAADVEIRVGDEDATLLDGIDLVVPSPGVPATSPLLREAVSRGIPVVSEIELAARSLDVPLVAITGTNGKSTTTELVGAMLARAGRRPFVGGNLGTPLVDAVDGDFDVVVAEVSSFQLEWVESFRPSVGVFLNVSDDHLDRHGTLEAYAALKARLFARQGPSDFAILNRDDPLVAVLASDLAARVETFGSSPGKGSGASLVGNEIEVRTGDTTFRLSLARSSLLGAHNRENVMAAALAAHAAGAAPSALQAALDDFRALPHRMQVVHERAGVRYVDDSKGTNVGAVVRSLEGLPDGRTVLIAGGLSKGGDFSVARDVLARKARRIVLYGRARDELERSWRGAAEIESHEDFGEAVRAAAVAARSGDLVLLSPACASQDQFRDYAARGDAFATIVRTLP
ncbi:MAG: UDP-N-acetylmuramoyl-L-alanine--D-glutamate ligase [Deltaproteobacteria bacterium]|nr:UDP-N-acetylmuramoyl-L-alanine--D-glutamate ligase [Deltaproteobacteria bacterium]